MQPLTVCNSVFPELFRRKIYKGDKSVLKRPKPARVRCGDENSGDYIKNSNYIIVELLGIDCVLKCLGVYHLKAYYT